MKALLVFLLLVLMSNAWAVQGDTSRAELERADNRLNAVYQRVAASIDKTGVHKLKMAQRAWLTFRDLDCAWAYSEVPLDCLIQRTEERISALEETYFTNSMGAYVSLNAKK